MEATTQGLGFRGFRGLGRNTPGALLFRYNGNYHYPTGKYSLNPLTACRTYINIEC